MTLLNTSVSGDGKWIGAALVVMTLLVSSAPAQAQVDLRPGVRAGATFMKFGGENTSEVTRRTSYTVGGYLLANFEGPYALQPELNFIQKGGESVDGATARTAKLSYIEVPVLGKWQFSRTGRGASVLFAGPSLGINVGAEREASNGTTSTTTDISDEANTFELALQAGIGAEYSLDVGRLSADVRYAYGLTNVEEGQDTQNQGFIITAGISF